MTQANWVLVYYINKSKVLASRFKLASYMSPDDYVGGCSALLQSYAA